MHWTGRNTAASHIATPIDGRLLRLKRHAHVAAWLREDATSNRRPLSTTLANIISSPLNLVFWNNLTFHLSYERNHYLCSFISLLDSRWRSVVFRLNSMGVLRFLRTFEEVPVHHSSRSMRMGWRYDVILDCYMRHIAYIFFYFQSPSGEECVRQWRDVHHSRRQRLHRERIHMSVFFQTMHCTLTPSCRRECPVNPRRSAEYLCDWGHIFGGSRERLPCRR